MKIIVVILSMAVLAQWLILSWQPATSSNFFPPSADSSRIVKGEALFNQYCSGCHNFRQDGIGPQLGGLTKKVSLDWVERFIQNPQKMIASGDKRTGQLFKKFKTVMPSFPSLKQDEVKNIIAFL